jgi:flagellar biosynthesis protein FlhF
MRLERVVAKDARRATEQVLATFGPDALIVSNQRVNGMTEIVVAVDTDSPSADSNRTRVRAARRPRVRPLAA